MALPPLLRFPVPQGWVVEFHELFDVEVSTESYEQGFLKEDLLQLRRADGSVFVDVGWYGGPPAQGLFRVVVHRHDFRGPLLEEHQMQRQSEIAPLLNKLLRKYETYA